MNEVYHILDIVEEHFKNDPLVHAVTFGDVDEADLIKQTLFPLVNVNLGNLVYVGSTIKMSLNIIAVDIVDESKEYSNTFEGNNNLIDVLNTQAGVLNKFLTSLKRGRLNMDESITLDNEPQLDYISGEFGNNLSGFGTEVLLNIPNVQVFGC